MSPAKDEAPSAPPASSRFVLDFFAVVVVFVVIAMGGVEAPCAEKRNIAAVPTQPPKWLARRGPLGGSVEQIHCVFHIGCRRNVGGITGRYQSVLGLRVGPLPPCCRVDGGGNSERSGRGLAVDAARLILPRRTGVHPSTAAIARVRHALHREQSHHGLVDLSAGTR